MKENPFKYGKEVTGEYFCNRKKEIEDILKFMRSSTNLIIFSQRRFGKTSLIKETLIRVKKEGMAAIYVDLGSVLSEKTFVQTYSRAIAESISGGPIDKLLTLVKELFRKLRPSITLDEFTKQPKVEFSLDKGELVPYIEDVLSLPQRYQRKLNKKIVVVFDEFQEIGKLENDRLEKLMRSFIQTHQDICYIFSGSKRHLIYEMFSNPNRPFYKSASHYPIGKIKKEELSAFIIKRFKDTSRKISDESVSSVLEICESHPYYVQFLCSILWDLTKGDVDVEDVLEAVEVLMERESASYTNTWDLLTIPQKKLLVAIAKKTEDEKLFSADFLSRYELGYPSGVNVSLQSLMKKDIIDKEKDEYSIIDVMFKKWILQKYPQQM
jgi:AAA+ ATPase superfamily predicted ATPase